MGGWRNASFFPQNHLRVDQSCENQASARKGAWPLLGARRKVGDEPVSGASVRRSTRSPRGVAARAADDARLLAAEAEERVVHRRSLGTREGAGSVEDLGFERAMPFLRQFLRKKKWKSEDPVPIRTDPRDPSSGS